MRPWSLTLLALAMLAAGCADTGPVDTGDEDGDAPVTEPTPREPIEHSGTMAASADVTNIAGMPICSSPSAQCDEVPFTVTAEEAPLDLTATLSWGLESNDLDLYLYQGETEVSNDGINIVGDPPNSEQVMDVAGLAAGEYRFIIVGWNAVAESYTLSVTFA